jgi:3-deoxy-D-manno-octulosonic-acid transferase
MNDKPKKPGFPMTPVERAALGLYDVLWRLALPALKRNQRLADGFEERLCRRPGIRSADIWIQAASVGEAYLVWELIKAWPPHLPVSMLLTTNTLQGKEILNKAMADVASRLPCHRFQVAYFPFDRPSVMRRAVCRVQPAVTVLLETEIWPGLLTALRLQGSPVVIINGRLTPRSLSRYRIWPAFWKAVRPDAVLAISNDDADRFATMFGKSCVGTMPNIKFDRIGIDGGCPEESDQFDTIVQPGAGFIVLGSVRQPEEADVTLLIRDLKLRQPDAVIGLFPRHIHRLGAWQKRLTDIGIPWVLRSTLSQPASAGEVVLWDRFGELGSAYRRAAAAFVGGSLAPLGGQNFLEPLVAGIQPVIGPYWDNFTWVGTEIMNLGLVHRAKSWQDVSVYLRDCFARPSDRSRIKTGAETYIRQRQGGTQKALALMLRYVSHLR